MAQPSIVGAQAAPGPLGPPNLGGTTLPTASDAILRGQDPYPRATTPVSVVRGGRTISVRPLQTTLLASGKEALQGRLLVSFTGTITDADLSAISAKAAKLGAGAAHPLVRIGTREFMVDVTGAGSIEAAAKAFASADARVQGASPDYVIQAAETPNDTDFSKQWGPQKIQAPAAWNRTHGSSSKVIAILDTGLNDQGSDAHPEFAGKVLAHQDFSDSSVGTDDVFGHGTHVAGIAAALTNNNFGVAGMGFNSSLIVGKVLGDDGKGSVSQLSDGIYWAADHGATVINMSLAGDQDCSTSWWEDLFDTGRNELRDAIGYAWGKNIVLVAAAGNNGNSNQLWPAACPNVLSVANTDQSDARNSTSNFGTWVDVAAPGTAIWSTAVPGGSACQGGMIGAFANCSGTSMASPHVAGLAALVQASCPFTTSSEVVTRITGTADPIGGTGSLWQFGRVNAFNAVCFPAPINLRLGTVTATSQQLLWTDTTPGESSFQVARSVTGSGAWIFFTTQPNATTLTDQALTPGVSYDHMVRACDAAGCSGWSNTVTGTAGSVRLTVSVSGGGKVTGSGINCGLGFNVCSALYTPGTVVSLHAQGSGTPGKGAFWLLSDWTGACAGFGVTCTLTMNSNLTTKAEFERGDL